MVKEPKLVDAVAMNREFPSSFEVPSFQEIKKMEPPFLAKVIAEPEYHPSDGPTGERFWIRVLSRDFTQGEEVKYPGEEISFTGLIENDLILTAYHDLNDGDEIKFKSYNIIQIARI